MRVAASGLCNRTPVEMEAVAYVVEYREWLPDFESGIQASSRVLVLVLMVRLRLRRLQ